MEWLVWGAFGALILGLLALDLGVFNRKAHVIQTREALAWTAFYVALSLLFSVAVYQLYERDLFGIASRMGTHIGGADAALQYLTGFVVEKSLSLDNIFVIALIFTHFGVPPQFQHGVLFWGVLGALIMRGAMIAAGAALIHRFEWIVYVFGGMLLLTAVKLLLARHDTIEPDRNWLVRLARRFLPVTSEFQGGRYFVVEKGRRAATPLFIVLLLVESTDVLFAVDSIPAVFAVTRDPFLVFTSNVFAILGLRCLYFALAGLMDKFQYLQTSLVFLLAFIGVKMILAHHVHIPMTASMAVILGVLFVGVTASVVAARRNIPPVPPAPPGHGNAS